MSSSHLNYPLICTTTPPSPPYSFLLPFSSSMTPPPPPLLLLTPPLFLLPPTRSSVPAIQTLHIRFPIHPNSTSAEGTANEDLEIAMNNGCSKEAKFVVLLHRRSHYVACLAGTHGQCTLLIDTPNTHPLTFTHSLTLSHTSALSLTHILTFTHSLTHTLTHTLSHTYTHTLSHTYPHPLNRLPVNRGNWDRQPIYHVTFVDLKWPVCSLDCTTIAGRDHHSDEEVRCPMRLD